MGLLDAVKDQFLDVIEYVDQSNKLIVSKYQRESGNNELKQGSKVIVRESQNAVFLKGGKLADILPPGTYSLTTDNFPVLSSLKAFPYLFVSPVIADVYFVSTRQFIDNKWATKNPIMKRDKDFNMVRIRSFGKFAFRITEQPKNRVCKNCNNPLPEKATVCPSCGAKNKKPIYKKWWFWLIIALIVIGAASSGGTESDPSDNQPSSSVSSGIKNDAASGGVSSGETEDAPSNEPSETDSIPKEYKSALKKAESYSETMHMSKAAIYDQLVSEYGEQFSEEAAQYAIDNLVADWNANALAKAEDYAKTMQMSKAGIYDQLISEYGEKFTPEEAQYAVDNVEADWKANALAKAESYQEMMSMSPSAIYDQLVSEYGEKFTAEEAQYAIDNLS